MERTLRSPNFHSVLNIVICPSSLVPCLLASASHSLRRSNRVLPDGSAQSSMKCSKFRQSRLNHHILHSVQTPPPWLFNAKSFHPLASNSPHAEHANDVSLPQARSCQTIWFPSNDFVQINYSSSAFDICTSSAAPETYPSPSGSARTPVSRKARSTRSGHAMAHARLRSAAR